MLVIDMTSPQWNAIEAYCRARIEALKDQAVSPTASAADREQAAYRCAELQDLLKAPRRTVELSRTRETTRSTY